jgi:hypothetical protein
MACPFIPETRDSGKGHWICLNEFEEKLIMTLQEQIESKKLAEIWTTAKIAGLGIPEPDAAALSGSIYLWERAEGRGQRGINLSVNENLWARCRHRSELRVLYECLLANSKMLAPKEEAVRVEKAGNKASKPKKIVELPIAEIVQDSAMQPRTEMNEAVVQQYAELMSGDADFPPVVVFQDDGKHLLADGFHRIAAAERAGLDRIAVEIKQGSRRDAILFAIAANSKHGLNWTNADKRRAVGLLLEDAEWKKWSSRVIAGRCGVGHTFVDSLRRELSGIGGQIERKAQRNGTEYSMDTSQIGKSQGNESSNQHSANLEITPPGTSVSNADDIEDGVPSPEEADAQEQLALQVPPMPSAEQVLLTFLRTSQKGSIAEMFQRAEREFDEKWPGFFRAVLSGIPRPSRIVLCRDLGIGRAGNTSAGSALEALPAPTSPKESEERSAVEAKLS